jgi:Tfp pilus assembly protein PilP
MVVAFIRAGIAIALLVLLTGCSEDPIGGTTTDEFAAQRDRLKAALAKKDEGGTTNAAPVVVAQPPEDAGYGAVGEQYVYETEGKRDPFRSIRFVDEEVATVGFGPLGDFELAQLEVVAVVWDTKRPRAVVTDPGGRAFIVHEGSQIGKNSGRVIHIGDNLLLVKETYVDFEGNQSTKDVEMRIRRSQGG